MKSFDEEYQKQENLFGHPYRELQDYFKALSTRGSVLDLGCGQGRDALFLASLGYDVTAVDNSQVGIEQLQQEAKKRHLKITGVCADVLAYNVDQKFDIILFDMLLHSFSENEQKNILAKYTSLLNKEGLVCIVFPDDMNTRHFLSLLGSGWELQEEIVVKDVPKLSADDEEYTFVMIVVRPLTLPL